jgi:N-acetylglucosaminyl-diphospho-decaprenol L-rhamnosyltransferase
MVPGMAPDISVVIVSYKVPELLRACLASLEREADGCSYEVIVVENASGDGTAELVRDEFPAVRLIALEQNIGFAAGSNLGARAAVGEYLLLLNPDTELVGNTLGALLTFARAHPQAGLVGGRTLRPDGELDPGSCWGAQTLWSLVCFASGLSSLFRGSRLFNPESLAGWSRDSAREVDIVTGCLCLMPRAVWEQLDGFDESFFMYGEDADLATRARKRGYSPAITPEAVILHHVGASSLSADKREMNLRCRVALARKHWTPARATAAVALLQAGTGVRALGAAVTGRPSSPWPAVWRRRRDWRGGYA